MSEVDASDEKATAFRGFSAIVAQNPQAMEKSLLSYFEAIAQYEDMNLNSPVKKALHEVFQNVSAGLGEHCSGSLLTATAGSRLVQADDATIR
jgi:hypothetical protein